MPLDLELEAPGPEPRFRPDMVQRAVALAQKMEQERRETLSLEEVTQLAGELNLDPALLRQALAQVSAQEARRTTLQIQQREAIPQSRQRLARLFVALLVGLSMLIGMAERSTKARLPPPPTPVVVPMENPVQGSAKFPTPNPPAALNARELTGLRLEAGSR